MRPFYVILENQIFFDLHVDCIFTHFEAFDFNLVNTGCKQRESKVKVTKESRSCEIFVSSFLLFSGIQRRIPHHPCVWLQMSIFPPKSFFQCHGKLSMIRVDFLTELHPCASYLCRPILRWMDTASILVSGSWGCFLLKDPYSITTITHFFYLVTFLLLSTSL